jgi:hypothetical protein
MKPIIKLDRAKVQVGTQVRTQAGNQVAGLSIVHAGASSRRFLPSPLHSPPRITSNDSIRSRMFNLSQAVPRVCIPTRPQLPDQGAAPSRRSFPSSTILATTSPVPITRSSQHVAGANYNASASLAENDLYFYATISPHVQRDHVMNAITERISL